MFTELPHPVGCTSRPRPYTTLDNGTPWCRASRPNDNPFLIQPIAVSPAGVKVPFWFTRLLHDWYNMFIWLISVHSVFQSIPDDAVIFEFCWPNASGTKWITLTTIIDVNKIVLAFCVMDFMLWTERDQIWHDAWNSLNLLTFGLSGITMIFILLLEIIVFLMRHLLYCLTWRWHYFGMTTNKIDYLAKKDGMPNWVHAHPVDHIQSSAKGLWQENRCHEHPLDRIGKPWDFLNATTYGLCWTSTNIYYIHDCRIAVIGTVWPTIWKNRNHTGESERYRCCIKILLKQK